ncbi:MAG: DNA adenine methylase [Candidatus Aenigmarchaeota archaeon]|nr:DNA adenine methylase [Candidatus Aenigmarchaeota archaeon]
MCVQIPKFVKWAGGKTQLIEQFIPLFPKKFNCYLEPFVGSGAVFFHLIQNFKPKKIILSDINEELINAYLIIRDDVERLIVELKQHKEYHQSEGKKYYLTIRATNPNDLPPLERAARFIYLNKTCFNGLYRVNSKGKFNVPMGSYKNPDIIQEEKLKLISKLLQNVIIKVMSFEKIINLAKKGDFVYLDPPYYPLQKGKSFTTYSKNNFLEKEQELLTKVFETLDKKGCYVMESNSETKFIKNLYTNFKIHMVTARRMINCDGSKRGAINEYVITNYEVLK